MIEQYEVTIESQTRQTNEDGETKFGPVTTAKSIIECKSETAAAVMANSFRTPYNNVTVSRL